MTSKDFVTMNMSYPPAPWHLDGTALASFQPIDLATAKQFIPIDFDIVSVLPGKTLGCLYLSAYEPSSTLQYHELIVAPALVSYRGKIGAWISHIYVDNPQSVEGGRNIWGLPKQMADFTWDDQQVTVSQDRNCLCRVDRSPLELPLSWWGNFKISGNVFGGLERDILSFQGNVSSGPKWTPSSLTIPPSSPFASIDFSHSLCSVRLDRLHLTANAPSIVGQARSGLINSPNIMS
ncbi:acetoacetate decarboxylase family protein [Chamaesiphon sp. OTE_75_metabat_556]|uniref:acetoacetate decarboxylase family protein n=1 Tax=Chamaesiphon sp. OTE_75_metabat_556 TaxID=2964692 RepID=UPI00286C4C56|nr:acetoacetate decarboxylase family protein [Chamaesiphon sp. OTE_75_metabat_556]